MKVNMWKESVKDMEFILFLMGRSMKENGSKISNTVEGHIILWIITNMLDYGFVIISRAMA